MFENIINLFKKLGKKEENKVNKDTAKERLHLVLMQDRANVSADFLDMMKQEIIDVIKKYIDVDEKEIDVKLTNKQNSDGTTGAPALYANIPIISIKNEARKIDNKFSLNASKNDNNKNDEDKEKNKEDKEQKIEESKNDKPKEDLKEDNKQENKDSSAEKKVENNNSKNTTNKPKNNNNNSKNKKHK